MNSGNTYFVRAVDLGSGPQQEVDDVRVASSCSPDDGVDAVLLGHRAPVNTRPQGKGYSRVT